MRFTTQAEYGLICSVHLARAKGGRPVAAREMAESENLPADYTEKILRRLRQAPHSAPNIRSVCAPAPPGD